MKIAVLGTGMVGETIGSKLIEKGHEVMMGSRSAQNEKALKWTEKNGPKAKHGTFSDAALFGEIIFNCTQGVHSLEALKLADEKNLADKILIDIANPLDFSNGMPPSLAICNTDSLGEQIQRAFPKTKVVKALNTMNCSIMVNPGIVKGDHTVFMCGNDKDAKATVAGKVLNESFGWKNENIIDMGDISNARGTEALLLPWIRLWGALGHANFNFHIAGAKP